MEIKIENPPKNPTSLGASIAMTGGSDTRTGAERIADERRRQLEREHYEPSHDDDHDKGELAMAAVAYAGTAVGQRVYVKRDGRQHSMTFMDPWPWRDDEDKRPVGTVVMPDESIRLLEKAGALIAAEIDRRLRAARRG